MDGDGDVLYFFRVVLHVLAWELSFLGESFKEPRVPARGETVAVLRMQIRCRRVPSCVVRGELGVQLRMRPIVAAVAGVFENVGDTGGIREGTQTALDRRGGDADVGAPSQRVPVYPRPPPFCLLHIMYTGTGVPRC
eukprot:GHVU01199194.1.p1 GENE.GHVU01199194.1~~GHVU01199194.1.p1  ORF type:complete len:137 (-),score=1.01 GHVU01199194.1:386-796(-)